MPVADDHILEEEHGREPAPHFLRLLATVIDIALAVMLTGLFVHLLMPWDFGAALRFAVTGLTLEVVLLHFLLRFLTLLLWARTPGMLLTRTVLLDPVGNLPSVKERFLAGCFVLYRGVDYYLS